MSDILRLVADRHVGKTETLIKLAAANNYLIVCAYQKDVIRITKFARDLGLTIPSPITFYDYLYGKTFLSQKRDIQGVLIDDVNRLLGYISRDIPLKGYTITGQLINNLRLNPPK